MSKKPTVEDTSDKATKVQDMPAAGPHAKPSLTDYEKTPGVDRLTDEASQDDVSPGSG